MKFNFRNSLFIFLLLLLSSTPVIACVDNFAKFTTNTFGIERNGNIKKIKLDIVISDWRVDCTKSRAVVWGQTTKNISQGLAPYASVYFIDTIRDKVLSSYTTTRGPFDVQFSKKSKYILVDDFVIDFTTAEILRTEIPDDLAFEKEACPDFPGQTASSP